MLITDQVATGLSPCTSVQPFLRDFPPTSCGTFPMNLDQVTNLREVYACSRGMCVAPCNAELCKRRARAVFVCVVQEEVVMNNEQSTRKLMKRIALLLVVSIFAFVASSFIRLSPRDKAAPLNSPNAAPTPSPPYIPTFIRRVNLQANNLVY